MTDQKLVPGATYKAEAEFTVRRIISATLVVDTKGRYWRPKNHDKITQVSDRFIPGCLYEDETTGQIYRRTGFFPEGSHPRWDEVTGGGGYVRAPETVNEARLVRLYREGEKK